MKDCRDCLHWETCLCGKVGHNNGTSIGYSIGQCMDFTKRTKSMKEIVMEIVSRPSKTFTKSEARNLLIHLGVLNEVGNVTEPFQDIFVKKEVT